MSLTQLRIWCSVVIVGFTAAFCLIVIPALLEDRDVLGAFAAGFVNPYSTGYSTDVLFCWLALLGWVLHDRSRLGVQHGWICLAVGIIPGVAVGFALYVLIRSYQIQESRLSQPPPEASLQNTD